MIVITANGASSNPFTITVHCQAGPARREIERRVAAEAKLGWYAKKAGFRLCTTGRCRKLITREFKDELYGIP